MKAPLRHYAVETLSLFLISQFVGGMVFEGGLMTFLLTGLALTVGTLIVRPIINILLLPLNLVTFGLFKWFSSTVILYLVTLVVPGYEIVGLYFDGVVSKWIDIPAVGLDSTFIALVAFSFLLSLFTTIIYWVVK